MRRFLLAVVALGAGLLVVPAAHATTSADKIHGGCFYDALSNAPEITDGQTGVIGDASVTTTGDLRRIGAVVTCWLQVNGVTVPETVRTYGAAIDGGLPVQAGADPISFWADSSDTVTLCESVNFADGTTVAGCPPESDPGDPCQPGSGSGGVGVTIPPQDTEDMLVVLENAAFGFANECIFLPYVDPAVCPVLAQLAGNYPGGVTVGPDGDLDIPDPTGLQLWTGSFYDCPPYQVTP